MKKKEKHLFLITIFSLLFLCISCAPHKVDDDSLYNINEMLMPVWEGDTSYNESVLVVEEKDGSIKPINLLYKIDKILSIKSASLLISYEEGKDYLVENGSLIINTGGSIPRLTFNEFHPEDGFYRSYEGGALLVTEDGLFHNTQIVVTYTHSDPFNGFIPPHKGNLLPRFNKKIQNKEDINILFYGDSITTGSNSSGKWNINVSPFMPPFTDLLCKGIEEKYQCSVSQYNYSLGGQWTDWGIEHVRDVVESSPYNTYDLIFIAFGMNDGYSALETANKMNIIANKFLESYTNAEIVYVATMLPNPLSINAWMEQYKQGKALLKYEKEGMVVADVGRFHDSLLYTKRYQDMTGNNINHPNDYLARVYAQVLFQTITIEASVSNQNQITNGIIISIAVLLFVVINVTIFLVVNKKKKN